MKTKYQLSFLVFISQDVIKTVIMSNGGNSLLHALDNLFIFLCEVGQLKLSGKYHGLVKFRPALNAHCRILCDFTIGSRI